MPYALYTSHAGKVSCASRDHTDCKVCQITLASHSIGTVLVSFVSPQTSSVVQHRGAIKVKERASWQLRILLWHLGIYPNAINSVAIYLPFSIFEILLYCVLTISSRTIFPILKHFFSSLLLIKTYHLSLDTALLPYWVKPSIHNSHARESTSSLLVYA